MSRRAVSLRHDALNGPCSSAHFHFPDNAFSTTIISTAVPTAPTRISSPASGTPALPVANWGGLGLHLRGTIEAFNKIRSTDKWLKVESGPYFTTPMLPNNVALQLKFFDRYLKGIANGWESEPRVEVSIRATDDSIKSWIPDTE